jgi:hypothetical protein
LVIFGLKEERSEETVKKQLSAREDSQAAGAEQRLKELGIALPAPPEPFGIYVEAVQTGNLLFLTGMLPTEGRAAKFHGRVGAELESRGSRSLCQGRHRSRQLLISPSFAAATGRWPLSSLVCYNGMSRFTNL